MTISVSSTADASASVTAEPDTATPPLATLRRLVPTVTWKSPPLLRPSCEELIWISYLASIPAKEAEKLIRCKAVSEVRELHKAQRAADGQGAMKKLGLLRYYKRSEGSKEAMRAQIRAPGETLAWPADTRKEGRPPKFPSVLWLAKRTRRKDIYDYIYGATSHFVHFSVHGLLRMASYTPGRMSVRFVHFRDYWAHFPVDGGSVCFSNLQLNSAGLLACQNGG